MFEFLVQSGWRRRRPGNHAFQGLPSCLAQRLQMELGAVGDNQNRHATRAKVIVSRFHAGIVL